MEKVKLGIVGGFLRCRGPAGSGALLHRISPGLVLRRAHCNAHHDAQPSLSSLSCAWLMADLYLELLGT